MSLPSWSCGFNLQLVERFWVFFLGHTAPGFQLWFYFHLYIWVIHWGLALEAALEGLGLPLWGPGVEVVQLLGSQGLGGTRYSGGVGGQGSRKYSALEGYGNQSWPIRSSILAWRTPSLTEKPGRPQSTGSQRVGHYRSDPVCINATILPVAALPQWELSVKVVQLFGLRGPWWHQVCRATDCLRCRSYDPIRVFWARM